MDERTEARLVRYVPTWLPTAERSVFAARLNSAIRRHEQRHGDRWARDPLVLGRLVGGVAVAFRTGKVGDAAWGRRMLARRGGLARVQAIALAGEQVRATYADLGRRGAQRLAERRRFEALTARLGVEPPSRRTASRSRPRHWMAS